MSYQVLARKWRPRVFKEMVGQEHVLKALINALDNNRLHHAYLFTGTRGVGKTTIARILAKCLNCEVGISSEPCDQCGACTEINQGRFVDLIEVDAASRTKVEDTRELMDNVQYMPSKGRFKVYLIDEVHMLSGHSFNALLKTLEEPPPHVKFLLATTDPQKLPITILSRCLQFNLKNLSPERIEKHLEFVLQQEGIPFETSALWQLARSADGSMRDALSLTDQAISFGNGQVEEADVSNMLGTIDQRQIVAIVEALIANDAKQMLACVEAMAQHIPDYAAALAELIVFLHRIAIAQTVPEAIDNTYGDQQEVLALATQITAEDVQLFYQSALLGRRDLPLAPDPRCGFEMVLLRMLVFKPQLTAETLNNAPTRSSSATHSAATNPTNNTGGNRQSTQELQTAPEDSAKKSLADSKANMPTTAKSAATETIAKQTTINESAANESITKEPIVKDSIPEKDAAKEEAATTKTFPAQTAPKPVQSVQPATENVQRDVKSSGARGAKENETPIKFEAMTPELWHRLVKELDIGGVIQNTAVNCQLISCDDDGFLFLLDEGNSTLYDESHQQRLQDAIQKYFAKETTVTIRVGTVSAETPAVRSARLKAERQAQALRAMRADPIVQELVQNFGATLNEDSVVPVDE